MGAPKQTLTLDVGRRNASRHVVYLGEGDVNGTTLVVSVTEGGRPFDCNGFTPFLMVPLRGGAVYRCEGTASGNVVTIAVDESALGNVSGKMPNAFISLEGEDGTMTSTQRFDVWVIESNRDAVAPDTFVTDLEALSARVAALEEAIGVTKDVDGEPDGGDDPQDDGTGGDPHDGDDGDPQGGDGQGNGPQGGDEPSTDEIQEDDPSDDGDGGA